jgi:hypothetical protein
MQIKLFQLRYIYYFSWVYILESCLLSDADSGLTNAEVPIFMET